MHGTHACAQRQALQRDETGNAMSPCCPGLSSMTKQGPCNRLTANFVQRSEQRCSIQVDRRLVMHAAAWTWLLLTVKLDGSAATFAAHHSRQVQTCCIGFNHTGRQWACVLQRTSNAHYNPIPLHKSPLKHPDSAAPKVPIPGPRFHQHLSP